MALRCLLINEALGSLVIDKYDPIGINDLTQTIKRSEDNDGVTYVIIFDQDFIKAGREFIKMAYETSGGVDAVVRVRIFERDVNRRRWVRYAEGQIDYNRYSLGEHDVVVNIEQTDFQRRVLNLLETDVNLETTESEDGTALPAQNVINLPLHSKSIQYKGEYRIKDSISFDPTDENLVFLQFDWDATVMDDIQKFTIPNAAVGFEDIGGSIFAQVTPQFEAPEDGEYEFDIKIVSGYLFNLDPGSGYSAASAGPNLRILKAGLPIASPNFSNEIIDLGGDNAIRNHVFQGTLSLKKGDQVAVFAMKDKDDYLVLFGEDRWNYLPSGVDLATTGPITLEGIQVIDGSPATEDTLILVKDQTNPVENGFYLSKPGAWERIFNANNNKRAAFVNGGDLNGGLAYKQVLPFVSDPSPTQWELFVPSVERFRPIPSDIPIESYCKVNAKTLFRESTTKAVLSFEAVERCCQFITNQVDCLKSDLLGRTDIVRNGVSPYSVDGEASLVAHTNGRNIKEAPAPIFSNLKDLIEFINSVHCAGFGFESVGGRQVLRLEKKSYFYNKNSKILSLGKVHNVKKKVDPKRFNNLIEYGYNTKLDVSQVNGVDEFNTIRKSRIPIVNTKNTLKVSTKMIAGGYQIESQRRLIGSTKDGKLDDNNFVICVIRDLISKFRSKKNEGYASIENVFDPATGYNYDISPARMLKNWLNYIASSLIRSSRKDVSFSSGEVNYLMSTRKVGEINPLPENGTQSVQGQEPIWENEIYEFEHPLTREQMQLIKNNPYGYIEFEDLLGEVMEGFVLNIEHNSTEKTAEFELLKVNRIKL